MYLGLEADELVVPGSRVVDEVSEGHEVRQGRENVGSRAVGHRVEPHLDQLLFKMSVPEILYFVVCSSGQVSCYCGPPKHNVNKNALVTTIVNSYVCSVLFLTIGIICVYKRFPNSLFHSSNISLLYCTVRLITSNMET